MKHCYFLLILYASYCLPVQAVLVTCTIFTDSTGREIHLFGDDHNQSTNELKQYDKDQLYAFQESTRKAAMNNSTTYIYCEVPCSTYYLVNKNLKVTASLVPFIKSLSHTSSALVAQDSEIRGPAVAADFLLTQTAMLKYKLEDLPFTTNGTTISLAKLTFDDILKHADILEQQVKVQHKVLFGNHYADMVKIGCAISKENRQKLQQQLQALALEPTSLVLEISRLLVNKDKLEQRQQLWQTIHDVIDPLFSLALMHKIHATPAEKVVVCAGYNHTHVLSYYFTELGFTKQASIGSSACPEGTVVPLDLAYCTF